MKNKKWIGIIVAIVCIVLIIVGIMAVKSSRKSETERKSAVDDSTENSDGAIEGEEIPFEVTEGGDAVLEDDTEGNGADGSGGTDSFENEWNDYPGPGRGNNLESAGRRPKPRSDSGADIGSV